MVDHKMFDNISVLLILVNCYFMATEDPLDRDPNSAGNVKNKQVESVFQIIFTVEMLVKMVAMGLYGKDAYLSDGWNRLDFVVVTLGWITLTEITKAEGAQGLRAIRVLRPRACR